MGARFLLMISLAYYLSPGDVGIFTLMYASTTLGILLLGARFDVYSTRAICASERTNAAVIIRDQAVFHLLIYLAVLPLMMVLFWTHLLPSHLIAWFYVLLILEHVGQECNRLFVALSQPLRATFVFFIRSGAWAVVLIPAMVLVPSFRNLQAVWTMWAVGGFACLVCSAGWMRSLGWRVALKERIDWSWIKRGLKPSVAYTIAIGATLLTSTVDRYFLQATWSNDYVGVYGFYSNLTNFVPTFAETGIISILLPALLSSTAKGNWGVYRQTLAKMTKGVLVIVLAASVFSIGLTPIILKLVDKDPIYGQYLPAFVILVISAVLATLSAIPSNALYANHKDREIAKWSVISLVVSLGFYATLAPPFGIYGVCFGSLAASATLLIGKLLEARKMHVPSE